MRENQRGVAYFEMIVVLFPVLLVFMGITQLSLAHVARLVVRHAASVTVRAAVVVLEDDPAHHRNEPRGSLGARDRSGNKAAGRHGVSRARRRSAAPRTSAGGASGLLAGLLDAFGRMEAGSGASSRRRAIERAAMFPLLAIAPDPRSLLAHARLPSVRRALGDVAARASGGLLYLSGSTAVTFPRKRGASELRERRYGIRDEVVVRITYLYHCAVPLVANILCHHGLDLKTGLPITGALATASASVKDLQESAHHPEALADAARRARSRARALRERAKHLEALKPAMRELEHVPLPWLRDALLAAGGHFLVLQAEAALPNQGAGYERRP